MARKMKFIDLQPGFDACKEQIYAAIARVLESGNYIMGEEISELENILARYVGVNHALSCSSGTDAIVLALMALDIGAGDAVVTTPHTFVATAEAIGLVGAIPVFCDIDGATQNICPRKLEDAIRSAEQDGKRLRAVIAVDMDGVPADYAGLEAVCKKNGLLLIEDGAQSFGSEYQTRRCGGFGNVAATSFYPSKPLGCYGDGGMVFTGDDELCARIKSIRVHGQGADKYEHLRLGLNARFDTLQAAIMIARWPVFLRELELRQKVAATYSQLFGERLKGKIALPEVPAGCKTSWAQYTVCIDEKVAGSSRDDVQRRMAQRGVPTGVYYPTPLHLQPAFAYLGHKPGDFPAAERRAQINLSLPFGPYLAAEVQEEIVYALAQSI